jgi:hypothetical protein
MVFQSRPIILAIWRVKMYRIGVPAKGQAAAGAGIGEVSERLIELVSKTSVLLIEYRGFESHPLRHSFTHLKVSKRMARSRPPSKTWRGGSVLRFAMNGVAVFELQPDALVFVLLENGVNAYWIRTI